MSAAVTKSKVNKELEEVLWFFCKLIIFGMVCIVVGLGYVTYRYKHEQLPLQYTSWSKHTGNPNNLTFEEWKYLPRETRKR